MKLREEGGEDMVRLYRIGADPEFLFVYPAHVSVPGVPTMLPAFEIITKNKQLGMASFIGVDSHSATAELRPSPSNDVRRVVHDLAHGISHIGSYLENNERYKSVVLAVPPHMGAESLGGHIHVSFFVDDEWSFKIEEEHAAYFGFPSHIILPSNGDSYKKPFAQGESEACVSAFKARCRDGKTISPTAFGDAMDYLFAPLDFWVHDRHLRNQRMEKHGPNGPYGVPGHLDNVRPGTTSRPKPEHETIKNHAYMHWEYRLPTVWLAHPWLAYAYLALAKLVMANFMLLYNKVNGLKKDERTTAHLKLFNTDNDAARAMFEERLTWYRKKASHPADTAQLDTALGVIADNWRMWASRGFINIRAWRDLIA